MILRHVVAILVSLLTLLCILPPQFQSVSALSEIETTREELLQSRQRRAQQLEVLLNDAHARLQDHNAQIKLLDNDERLSLERKVELYARKLEMLNQVPDEMEIERILYRERARDERVHARRAQSQENRGRGDEL